MIFSEESPFDIEFNNKARNKSGYSETSREGIRRLIEDQSFCVLCTQGQSQPYGSLIAFVSSEDLKHIYFTTSVATRKYRLLIGCDRAALLIDNRNRHPDSLMDVAALTVTGRTRHLKAGQAYKEGITLLTQRHPYLKSFIRSETTALFRFNVNRYLYVTRFREVQYWMP
jgi:nitroimidazol reductase NimA-like FMN-containing flavoprotein (pyridoxamine 5'-phosphate oxidase superfamily)